VAAIPVVAGLPINGGSVGDTRPDLRDLGRRDAVYLSIGSIASAGHLNRPLTVAAGLGDTPGMPWQFPLRMSKLP
jgi:hypothetical protein